MKEVLSFGKNGIQLGKGLDIGGFTPSKMHC